MQTRTLGRHGPAVSALGLGCMGMSAYYDASDARDEAEGIATIHRALDLDVTLFDTADIYGEGANETLLGRALRGRRNQAFVATKFGFEFAAPGEAPIPMGTINGRPEYVRKCIDASLARLGMDYVDLYYQHRVDPSVPIEDTVGAMADLVKAGKVRHLGLSEAAPDTLRRAQSVHPVTALQSEYSLWTREPEINGVFATCRDLGIGFVAYSPLGRGFLTGQIQSASDLAEGDSRRSHPRFTGDNFDRNLALAGAVKALAEEKGCTPAQLALAWVLAQGDDMVPIPGTKRVDRLEQNLDALKVELSQAERAELEATFAPGAAEGDRYPAPTLALVHR